MKSAYEKNNEITRPQQKKHNVIEWLKIYLVLLFCREEYPVTTLLTTAEKIQ